MKKRLSVLIIIFLLTISIFVIYFISLNREGETGILKGKVILHSGNCMPAACLPEGCPPSTCFSGGVKMNISIRKLKIINNISSINFPNKYGFFNNNDSDLIQTIQSNESGDFMVKLPIGNYSVFIVENGRIEGIDQTFKLLNISANEWCDKIIPLGDYFIACPIEIKKDQTANFDLEMNFASV